MTDTAGFIGFFIVGVVMAYLILGSEHSKKSGSNIGVSEKYVRICPRCGSQDIGLDTDNFKGFVEMSGKLFYKCNKCSYIFQTFVEMIEEAATDFESVREGHWKKPGGWRFRSIEAEDSHRYFLYISAGVVFYMIFGELVILLIIYVIIRNLFNRFQGGGYACYGQYEADDEGCIDCDQTEDCEKETK